MSRIAVIVKAEQDVVDLPKDWMPVPLGSRDEVTMIINRVAAIEVKNDMDRISLHGNDLSLELEIDEGPEPRSITVSGSFGDNELELLKTLCHSLSARLYDAESGSFEI